jgi:hypothetical protein
VLVGTQESKEQYQHSNCTSDLLLRMGRAQQGAKVEEADLVLVGTQESKEQYQHSNCTSDVWTWKELLQSVQPNLSIFPSDDLSDH